MAKTNFIITTKGNTPTFKLVRMQVTKFRTFTCIVMELLPAAILGTKATGVGAEGELLAELCGITVRRGTEGRPPGTTGII
jgi:hypothetical protein